MKKNNYIHCALSDNDRAFSVNTKVKAAALAALFVLFSLIGAGQCATYTTNSTDPSSLGVKCEGVPFTMTAQGATSYTWSDGSGVLKTDTNTVTSSYTYNGNTNTTIWVEWVCPDENTGSYTLYIRVDECTPTGISMLEEMELGDRKPVYRDLYGNRVEHPQKNTLYLRSYEGNAKVTKVILVD